jgi:mono/diheme cytochrome c family protein
MINREFILMVILLPVAIFIAIYVTPAFGEEKFSSSNGEKIYQWYCAPCHGIKGDGKGFNAKNLDPRPANHTDPALMTKRTDNDLFEAISGGGKRVGKSTLMPPWGNTFSKTQITSLVMYLRKLCRCQAE